MKLVRARATREKIGQFMRELGRAVKSPGRVYFTGGVSAVLLGWRDSTMDLDLKALPEPAGFFEALPRIKTSLDLSVELASPDDFVPALPGWEERSVFIATEGKVTFLHYDFYGQALAKAERIHDRDILDIGSMVKERLVDPALLLKKFEEVEENIVRYPAIEPMELRATLEKLARGEL